MSMLNLLYKLVVKICSDILQSFTDQCTRKISTTKTGKLKFMNFIYFVRVEVKYPRLHQQMHFTNIRIFSWGDLGFHSDTNWRHLSDPNSNRLRLVLTTTAAIDKIKATFTRDRIFSDPFGIGSTMVRIHPVYMGPVRNWNCMVPYWIT